jgi:hypothetical protein
MVVVYVDNFMSIVIPVSQYQLHHVANAIMHGIHNVAVPRHEVRRLRGRSRPRLIWSARQPAILSSNAEGNRS